MMPVKNVVFVAIDVGQNFWAEVTPQAATELQVAPDSQLVCLLKTHGLKLVP
jgi:hypothetical protein